MFEFQFNYNEKKLLRPFVFSAIISCHAEGYPHIGLLKTFVDLQTDGVFYEQQPIDKLTKQ